MVVDQLESVDGRVLPDVRLEGLAAVLEPEERDGPLTATGYRSSIGTNAASVSPT